MNIGNRYSQHSFAMIPDVHLSRSKFNRSFGIKDTFNFDYLIPIYVDEIIPGDTHNVNVNAFARLATQLVPIMDNMYIDFFFFFVPNRLTYDNWEKLNGAQTNPGDTTDYVCPQLTFAAGKPDVDTIFDKFGLPTDISAGYTIKNTMPLRAYGLIWNDWFRDENLQNSVAVPTDAGPDLESEFTLLKRGKRHDYFTSCLPWPQKGDAVELPLGDYANVIRTPNAPNTWRQYTVATNTLNTTAGPYQGYASGAVTNNSAAPATNLDPNGGLRADLSTATAATINQLRQAFMMQSLFELDARGGTRYVEILKAHFGVVSPDFRLQRPEFLGGGSVRINSHIVPQTAPTSGSNVQGQLAAFATAAAGSSNHIGFTKSFVEHGYVLGLACARADLTYQQGTNRMWLKSTRYDFFWPKFQQLGEQAVLNQEIYTQGTAADATAFGYQERYAEYRYKPSEIHGQFRSTYATSLDQWHLAEEFSSLPVLNSSFIQQNTPIDRAIAATTYPDLLFDCWFQVSSSRPMMTYSVPATLGRF